MNAIDWSILVAALAAALVLAAFFADRRERKATGHGLAEDIQLEFVKGLRELHASWDAEIKRARGNGTNELESLHATLSAHLHGFEDRLHQRLNAIDSAWKDRHDQLMDGLDEAHKKIDAVKKDAQAIAGNVGDMAKKYLKPDGTAGDKDGGQ